MNIVRPHDGSTSYTILLRFASHGHLQAWVESDTRCQLVDHVAPLLQAVENLEIHTGLEYWFTPPAPVPMRAKPYKQFLVTLSAIFPLTQFVPLLMAPLYDRIPLLGQSILGDFVVVSLIVFLMVYVIMPRYTRLVSRWLFS